MKQTLPLLLLFLFNNCNFKKDKFHEPDLDFSDMQEIAIEIESKDELLLSTIFQDIKCIALQTSGNNLIRYVDKLISFNDHFYILDVRENSLFIFKEDGSFENQIKKVGHGPGEYLQLTDFIIDEEENVIELYDKSLQKIYKFSLDGSFLQEVKVGIYAQALAKLDNNKYAFYDFYSPLQPYDLLVADENGEVVSKHFYTSVANDTVSLLTHHFGSKGENLSFLKWPGDTVYQINSKGVFPKYYFKFVENIASEIHYFTENDYFLTFSFPVDRKAFTGFYCKSTKGFVTGHHLINDINGIPFTKPIAATDSEFISIVSAYGMKSQFSKNYDKIKAQVSDEKFNQLDTFINSIKNEDNPVLILSTFKQF